MKRIWGQIVSLLVTALALSAVAPACAQNDKTIFIRDVMAPPANRQNGECIYLPDPNQPFLPEGLFDTGVRDDYVAAFIVGNQLIQRGDPLDPRAESNRVHITGLVSRVTLPDGTEIGNFTSQGVSFLEPQSNNAPGWGIIIATVIDAPTRNVIIKDLPNRQASKSVLVNVKAFGKTLGGVDVESGEYQFPIRACNGCLVTFSDGTDPTQPTPNCLKPLATTGGGSSSTVLPCNAGQDEATPCQLCQGRAVCDPRTP